jgi:GAF domain-containing protein
MFKLEQSYRVCSDISKAQFSSCYLETMKKYGVRAYLIVAIYHQQRLWGLLACYQNQEARNWTELDLNFVLHISAQLGIAIHQAELLGKKDKERFLFKVL